MAFFNSAAGRRLRRHDTLVHLQSSFSGQPMQQALSRVNLDALETVDLPTNTPQVTPGLLQAVERSLQVVDDELGLIGSRARQALSSLGSPPASPEQAAVPLRSRPTARCPDGAAGSRSSSARSSSAFRPKTALALGLKPSARSPPRTILPRACSSRSDAVQHLVQQIASKLCASKTLEDCYLSLLEIDRERAE